ncbi:hypothetical protein [Mammaliicoccus sciuri]|uniref:hypothetical protein n=1 Tax=Mammaliicoccus sciuri TaxID=1296 RepID=UPI00265BB72D|nr:hypothetical protein [Mammaliicoccus sciuri]MDO0957441.1 hypothetical protein [Mammaliicoccus sciuri]
MIKSTLITITLASTLHQSPALDITENTLKAYKQISNCDKITYHASPALDIGLSIKEELQKNKFDNNNVCKKSIVLKKEKK